MTIIAAIIGTIIFTIYITEPEPIFLTIIAEENNGNN